MSKNLSAQQDLLSHYLRKTTKKAREWYFFGEEKKDELKQKLFEYTKIIITYGAIELFLK